MSDQARRVQRVAAALEEQASDGPPPMPTGNMVDFITTGLNAPQFPRQMLIIKVILGLFDLITRAEMAVLDAMTAGYSDIENNHYVGALGTPADLFERIEHVKAQGRWSFRQGVIVAGRRSGKSQVAAVMVLAVVWRLLQLGDPHGHFRIRRGKPLMIFAMSTSQSTAVRDIFTDIRALVERSKWLAPYVVSIEESRITFRTPHDMKFARTSTRDRGTIVIEAAPATARVVRGSSTICAVLDEAAYMEGQGSTSTCEDILAALTPAMAQFGKESLLLVVSSPASQGGGFYDLYRRACEVDPDTGAPATPDIVTFHLHSWTSYEGWETTHEHEMYPDGPNFPRFGRPIIGLDFPEVADARRADELKYRREFLAEWASGTHPFLPARVVDRLFANPTEMKTSGDPFRWEYRIHIDPSATRANTAVAVAHLETVDGHQEVVFDYVHAWAPTDFDNLEISYRLLVPMLVDLINEFGCPIVSMDTYGGHALKAWIEKEFEDRGVRVSVEVLHATEITKRERWSLFRDHAAEGLIHLPEHTLARRELMALQDDGHRIHAPTTGPLRTDDLADAISWVVHGLVGSGRSAIPALSNLRVTGGFPGSPNPLADLFSSARASGPQRHGDPSRGIARSNGIRYR